MANLSNINNKFIVTDGGQALVNQTVAGFNPDADDLIVGNLSGNTGITIASGPNAGNYGSIYFADGAGSSTPSKAGYIRYEQNTSKMTIGINAVEKVAIDLNGNATFAGNVGIGITPSASFSGIEVLQLGGGMTLYGGSGDRATMASNLIVNTSTAFEYVIDGLAGRFSIEDGNMIWGTAPTGTAGSVATVDTKMTLLNNGNVGIGTTTPDYNLEIEATDAKAFVHYPSASRGGIAAYSSQRIAFTTTGSTDDLVFGYNNGATSTSANFVEHMRVDNGTGNVGIGSVTPRDKLTVFTAGAAEEEIALRLVNPIGFTNGGSGASIIFAQDRSVGENLPMAKIRSSQSIAGTSSYGDLIFSTLSSTMQDRMTILSGGNVGINTTSPGAKLEIKAADTGATTDYATKVIKAVAPLVGGYAGTKIISLLGGFDGTIHAVDFGYGYNGTGYNIMLSTNDNTTGDPIERMRIDSSGNATFQESIIFGNGAPFAAAASIRQQSDILILTGGGNGFAFNDDTNAVSNMLIDSGGYVGIGTASPATRLHVSGNFDPDDAIGYALIENTSASGGSPENSAINVRNHRGTSQFMQWENAGLRIGSRIITNGGAGDVYFTAGADSTKMVIKAGGNVGINTTSPSYKLAVNGDLRVEGNTSGTSVSFGGLGDFAIDAPGVGGGRFVVKHSSGNVGIGTPSPTYKLHVVSSNNVSIFEDTSDASGAAFIVFNRPGVFSMGSITRNGSANSVSYNTGSDYRLKEDLKDFNALDLVNNITAYDYKWKDVDQRDYGFIAHELKQTLPNVVTGEKDGEKMQGVDYSKLTPILLKAIQEQQEIINDLKSRIETLENK